MVYLYPQQIIYLHKQIIAATGGAHGLRDQGLLESAVYRPQASFGGHDLYPDLFIKTAVLGHAIINNHPFLDGNKRAGLEAMRLLLRLNGHDLQISDDKKYAFIMDVAEKKVNEQDMAAWIRNHSVTYKFKK